MRASLIVAEARKWHGVRWKHQGRDRDGIDCAGLVVQVAKALGLSEFDTRDYLRQAKDETMLALCDEHLVRVKDPMPGDIGVLRYDGTRHMVIFGDYAGGISIIHAYSRAPRRVVEHIFNASWLRSEQAVHLATFRFPGVDA
jgi:cell wall-associated NlpC family hydrolase